MGIINLDALTSTSRRSVLRNGLVLSFGVAALGAGAAQAATKMSQKAVSYQDKPRGRSRCDNCAQWQAPNGCKLVEGVISPAGWCTVYAPKS